MLKTTKTSVFFSLFFLFFGTALQAPNAKKQAASPHVEKSQGKRRCAEESLIRGLKQLEISADDGFELEAAMHNSRSSRDSAFHAVVCAFHNYISPLCGKRETFNEVSQEKWTQGAKKLIQTIQNLPDKDHEFATEIILRNGTAYSLFTCLSAQRMQELLFLCDPVHSSGIYQKMATSWRQDICCGNEESYCSWHQEKFLPALLALKALVLPIVAENLIIASLGLNDEHSIVVSTHNHFQCGDRCLRPQRKLLKKFLKGAPYA